LRKWRRKKTSSRTGQTLPLRRDPRFEYLNAGHRSSCVDGAVPGAGGRAPLFRSSVRYAPYRDRARGADVCRRYRRIARPGRAVGKVGVVVGNCCGSVGNRMYCKYQREAQFLVEEGAQVQDVDAALFNFGMALGPFAASDLSGLDVGWRDRTQAVQLEPAGVRRPLVQDRLCEMGRLGQKTGAGWYRYRQGDREPIPDPVVEQCIRQHAAQAGISHRTISPMEIIERTIFALVNEGAAILEEGIAQKAGDVDVLVINGYGFPAHRGGPMWFADTIGLERVYQRVREFEQIHGSLWTPRRSWRGLPRKENPFRTSTIAVWLALWQIPGLGGGLREFDSSRSPFLLMFLGVFAPLDLRVAQK